jgi:hypothetical protein
MREIATATEKAITLIIMNHRVIAFLLPQPTHKQSLTPAHADEIALITKNHNLIASLPTHVETITFPIANCTIEKQLLNQRPFCVT